MFRPASFPVIAAALVGCAAVSWTGNSVPHRVASVDTETVACAGQPCPVEVSGFRTHWISRTHSGELYVMVRSDCQNTSDCVARFVERTGNGIATRLDLQGTFHVVSNGKDVPDVESHRSVSESETVITRYTWVGGAYVMGESRQVFRVDGEACGTALECYQKAQAAREGRDTGKALQILETVHKVSYI